MLCLFCPRYNGTLPLTEYVIYTFLLCFRRLVARRLRNIWYEPVEPSGKYLCHSEFTPGIGINLAKDFTDVVAEQNAKESLLAVTCTWMERWFSGSCRVVSQNYPTSMACMPGKYSLFLVQFRLHMLMEN